MASLMLPSASARVLPCEMQPGSAGHSATNTPSSSGSITTRYFMLLIWVRRLGKSTVVSDRVFDRCGGHAFLPRQQIRPMIKTVPLAYDADAYGSMMQNEAHFRIVMD